MMWKFDGKIDFKEGNGVDETFYNFAARRYVSLSFPNEF